MQRTVVYRWNVSVPGFGRVEDVIIKIAQPDTNYARVGRLALFEKPGDYAAVEKVLVEACGRIKVRIAAYCLMSIHWHWLLRSRDDGELSEVMRWIKVT